MVKKWMIQRVGATGAGGYDHTLMLGHEFDSEEAALGVVAGYMNARRNVYAISPLLVQVVAVYRAAYGDEEGSA